MIHWERIDLPREFIGEKIEAACGDPDARKRIADCLIYWNTKGAPTKEDCRIARKLYRSAIREGDVSAMLNYGGMYKEKAVRRHSTVLAHYWFLCAVLAYRIHPWEDRSGYRALGNSWRYHDDKDGCPIPTENKLRLLMALFWYLRGARQEEMNSLYELGDYYLNGILVKKNPAKAFVLYKEALDAIVDGPCPEKDDNYDDVAFRLARCYHMGLGTEKNLEKAVEYIDIAIAKYQTILDKGGVWDKKNLDAAIEEKAAIIRDSGRCTERI